MRGVFWRISLISTIGFGGHAQASEIDSCARVMQFDTSVINENYLAKLSVLRLVNSSNYEEVKQKFSAMVPGYFDGTYDNFSKKREEFSSSFSMDSSIQHSTNFYQRVLSPVGAKAYSDCVAAVTKQPIVAYIASGQRSEYISVTIANNLAGQSDVEPTLVTPDFITRLNEPKRLSSGSQQTILFRSPLNQPFILIINAQDRISGASLSPATLELPPYIQYKLVSDYREVQGTGACGAGGNGSTAGSPLRRPAYLAAPADYHLLPETITLKSRQLLGGPGIIRDPNWNWIRIPTGADRPATMRGDPDSCEGASGHTQSTVEYTFSARAVKQSVVKVP